MRSNWRFAQPGRSLALRHKLVPLALTAANSRLVEAEMIGPGHWRSRLRWLAVSRTNAPRRIAGLACADPGCPCARTDGRAVFAFRVAQGIGLKLLSWGRSGLFGLYIEVLERGRFPWLQ